MRDVVCMCSCTIVKFVCMCSCTIVKFVCKWLGLCRGDPVIS